MAIRIEQPELAELFTRTAIEVSRARMMEREEERRQEREARRDAVERARQWELEKMELASRQDFEREMKAKAWDLEKMEISSRLDFEREERKRQRELDKIDAALEQIDKEVESGKITEEQADPLRFSTRMKKWEIDVPISLIKPPTERAPFGIAPWYLSPEYKDTPEGRAAIKKALEDRGVSTRKITPSQQLAAIKVLLSEELQEPTWLERLIPGGKGALTEEEEYYRGVLQDIAKGVSNIPEGIISPGLPEPKSQEEYDMIPAGERYIDSGGNIRVKRLGQP